MNKKYITIAIIVILVIAICFGIYKIAWTYIFEKDGGIQNSHEELLNHIKSIEDDKERQNQIEHSINQNWISEQEANELY